MDDVFLSILNQSLMGSVVILAICLARFPLRRAPKMISYCLWAVAGFRLAFPFSIESVFSLMPIAAKTIPTEIAYRAAPQIPSVAPVADAFLPTAPIAPPTPGVHPIEIWTTIGLCVWLAGVLALTAYGIVSFLKLKRKMRGATPLGGNLYETDGPPFVLGLFSPKIYIPAGVAGQERLYIILHEHTHVRRRDHIAKFVAWFLVCIHWFNPLAWLAFHLMAQDMEMACDERVLRFLGGGIRKDYSRALVAQAVGRRLWSGSPLAFGEGDVKRRILNVLRFKRTSRVVVALAILAATVLGVGFAVDRVGGAESTPPTTAESTLPGSEDFAAKAQSGALDAYIPQGMSIATGSLGDVDADGIEDAVLGLRADAGDSLLVLVGRPEGGYAVAAQSAHVPATADDSSLQIAAGEGMIELRYEEANGAADRDTTAARFAYAPDARDWLLQAISCQPTYAQDGKTALQPVFLRPLPGLENQSLSAFSYDAFRDAAFDLGAFDLAQSFTGGNYVFAVCLQRNEAAGTYEGYVYKNDLGFLDTGDFIQTVRGEFAPGEEWDTSSDAVQHTFTVQGDLWAYDEREDAFYLASGQSEAAGVTAAPMIPSQAPPLYGEIVPWGDALYEWAWRDAEPVTVVDFRTREAFSITRAGGAEQLEFEPTTAEDTAAIRACYGGEWSWARRPVLVDVDGTWVAASIAGMPHGKESVAGNDMEGGLCLYFSGSRDHGAAREDEEHEAAIREAAGMADVMNTTDEGDAPVAPPEDPPEYGEIVAWDEVDGLWAEGTSAAVVDFRTKERFTVTRIGGVQHADFETTTAEDTAILKECYDGKWSWNRRPVLVWVAGRWIAASINGYPHAEDALEGNGMIGTLCMHFEGSRAEGTGVVDEAHQRCIREAGGED